MSATGIGKLPLAPDNFRRVVERAQHSGDIAQRRKLGATLVQRLKRLALEIDDDDVGAGNQYLAKMEVAMNARAQCTNIAGEESANLLEDVLPSADKALYQDRFVAGVFVKRLEGILQLALRPPKPTLKHALVRILRRKIGIVRWLRQYGVHLTRATAEHAGELLVWFKRI